MGVSQDDTECEGSDSHGDGLRTDGGEPGDGPPTLDEKDSPSVTEIYDRWTEHEDAADGEAAEIEALRQAMDAAGVDVPDEPTDAAPAAPGGRSEPDEADAAGTGDDGASVEPSAETIRDGDAGTVERVVDPEVGRVVYTYGHAGGASVTTVPIEETDLTGQ